MASKRITLKMVADLAKVSISTVSLILRDKECSSFPSETVEKVKSAAAELGYGGFGKKEALSLFNKKVIAIITTTVAPYYYYSTLIQAIDQSANVHGYDTFCYQTYYQKDREFRILSLLRDSDIAGIIITFTPHDIEAVERLSKKIPVVIFGDEHSSKDINIDKILTNNYLSGILLSEHLIKLGHKNVGFVGTHATWKGFPAYNRINGVKDYFAKHPECSLSIQYHHGISELGMNKSFTCTNLGYDMTLKLLEENPNITAIIANSDAVAYGVIDAIKHKGLSIPNDISVCGIDNIFPSMVQGIDLTSVDHRSTHKGQAAVDLIIERIEHPGKINSIASVILRSKLVVRKSTAQLKEIDEK